MPAEEYINCEVQLSNYNQAVLRFGRDDPYEGKPDLDENFQQRLLEASLDPTQYGTMLFSALFPPNDDLRVGYLVALGSALREGKRLRFHLYIDANAPPKLHELNWELLYDPRKAIALSTSPNTAFSRYTSAQRSPPPALDATPKLLVVISSPSNLSDQGLAEIERGESVESIKKALIPLGNLMRYEILDAPATPVRIRQRLEADGFHALHIQAHGKPQGGNVKPSIVLEKDDGEADFVGPDDFWQIFEGNLNLRLITLITCFGGATPRDNPYGGLGTMLARQGLPAVIAMRRSISVEAAAVFSEHFYSNLARSGQVDMAVNEARRVMFLSRNLVAREWGHPALFMRLEDGKLWEQANQQPGIVPPGIGADINWQAILIRLSEGNVVPIIGPEINRGLLLSAAEVSERWAKEYNYPGDNINDLPRVAKFVETMTDINLPHSMLPKILRNDLLEREKVQNREVLKELSLSEVIKKVGHTHFDRDANEPHRILADMNISTYITTNLDSFMKEALEYVQVKRPALRKNCLWRKVTGDEENSSHDSPYSMLSGTYREPLVFHLYGYDENPRSLVLTEDDYLDFLRLVSRDPWRIPRKLKSKLTEAMLLFLGYNVRDLDFRVLFKGLVDELKEGTLGRIAVLQIHPDENYSQQVKGIQELQDFIHKDCTNLRIQVYWGTVRKFLTELRDRLATFKS